MGVRRLLLDGPPVTSLDAYIERGGGRAISMARELGVAGVLDEVTLSGLLGRGGAGFPVGLKWQTVAASGDGVGERFVVANGAEGEPGTFKDRFLVRHNPHQLVEGLLLAAWVVGARRKFIALKASFAREAVAVANAEIEAAGCLPDIGDEPDRQWPRHGRIHRVR